MSLLDMIKNVKGLSGINTSINPQGKKNLVEVLRTIQKSSNSIKLLFELLGVKTNSPKIQSLMLNIDDGTVDKIIDLVIKIIEDYNNIQPNDNNTSDNNENNL